MTDRARWSAAESLLSEWDARARTAAHFVPAGAAVLDIGCGRMALETFLPDGCRYLPCDLVKRDERTMVCDLNAGEFPADASVQADVIALLGVVEYVLDVPALFARLKASGRPVIVSYHPANPGASLDRKSLGWLNHYTMREWNELFQSAGFQVIAVEQLSDIQYLFKLSPQAAPRPRTTRVAVLSFANAGNFGDRLGFHVLQSVLPPTAIVEHHYFQPWRDADLKGVELLIVGIGNSLFQPLLTGPLQAMVESVPKVIGIFGTQYRGELDGRRLQSILDRMHTWYARYEEDVLAYGKGRANVVHLGDWLVQEFALSRWTRDRQLSVGNEIWNNLPLDRTIQEIQQYRVVSSSRLHPLLCALSSAERVAYVEQRESPSGRPSGKFRSMLLDVFGRTFPEESAWEVDRDKVAAYKSDVAGRIGRLRADLNRLLAS